MAGRIEHVVVLMLENRSFDNVLGRLYSDNEDFVGLSLRERNPWHKPDGSVEEIGVWTGPGSAAPGLPEADPGELFDDITMQIFGLNGDARGRPAMNGFVDNFSRQPHDPSPDPRVPMHYFDPQQLPVINGLAKSFGVSDCWFASAPCETWPNRYFAHAGTAGGYVNNERSSFPYRWPRFLRTIFRRLDACGYDWKVYFHDLPQTATLIGLWSKIPTRFCLFEDEFERHARSGRLPTYSFIEPRYYPSAWSQAIPNDQHPPHDMRHGEALIARVYNVVRAAPTWQRTLLIVTYDEHGGCYDHVPPPSAVPPGGPYPDGFSFDRYGVRVPAVIVSPYVAPGSIIRPAPTREGKAPYPFDHCSIQATLHKLFDLGAPLTPRVAAAPDLLPAFTLDAPDNNGPEHIVAEAPQPSDADIRAYKKRRPNHHQAALRGPMHGFPAAVAHATARVRGLGAKFRPAT